MERSITGDIAMILDDPDPIGRLKARLRTERETRQAAEAISEVALRALYENQRKLELVGLIAAHANESRRFLDALQFTLDHVCAYTGWPVGHAYFVSASEDRALVSAGLWHIDGPPGSFKA